MKIAQEKKKWFISSEMSGDISEERMACNDRSVKLLFYPPLFFSIAESLNSTKGLAQPQYIKQIKSRAAPVHLETGTSVGLPHA